MFGRYALFYTPPPGPLARFGARWLGWDSRSGTAVAQTGWQDLPGGPLDVPALTEAPRSYGLHATLKAPFVLTADATQRDLIAATQAFAARCPPAPAEGWHLANDHGFVALRPSGDTTAIDRFAADVVRGFDRFRAPLTAAYLARRRASGLSARQDRQLIEWGYPYIFDDFGLHLTLTGKLSEVRATQAIAAIGPGLLPLMDDLPVLEAISLMGEDAQGRFHEITRLPLGG